LAPWVMKQQFASVVFISTDESSVN
jgi:hypothetical protein